MNQQTREPQKEIVIQQQQIVPIKLDENGQAVCDTLGTLYRYADGLLKSQMLPKQFDSVPKIATAIQYAKELNLMALTSLRNIAVINGSPSLWGELPLAIVRKSGLLESINEWTIDKDYKRISLENKNIDAEIFAAVCCVKRRNDTEREFFYTKADADRNPNSKEQVWIRNRSIMMKRRARSIALKDVFGDVLGGVSIAEYDHDTIPTDPRSYQTESNSRDNEKARELNNRIFNKQQTAPIEEASIVPPVID